MPTYCWVLSPTFKDNAKIKTKTWLVNIDHNLIEPVFLPSQLIKSSFQKEMYGLPIHRYK